MISHGLIINALVYLTAAVIAVPLAKRLGLGSVLGYLIAGICIGPWGFGLITNAQDILHFAEFGVVLLLFLIGLELHPARLWQMRKPIIGVGGLQVCATTLLFFGIGLLLQLDWKMAFVAAFALSLSSTAIALQILQEKNLLGTPSGVTGFSILLLQDIAVIPLLTILPLLAYQSTPATENHSLTSALIIIAVIVAIIVGGAI